MYLFYNYCLFLKVCYNFYIKENHLERKLSIMNKIKNKIKSYLTNNIILFKLNFSFLIVGIFFLYLSYPNSNNIRANIGTVFLVLWFFFSTISDPKKRDIILIEFSKLVFFLLLGCILLIYFVKTPNYNSTIWGDILASLGTLALCFYFISCLISILKIIRVITSKIYIGLFNPSANNSPIKILFEHISAILIAVSGFLVTLISVINSVKTIINTIIS